MSEKRFEKSKSDVTDYRIYDYEKEDAYFIDCDDESTVDAIVDLLNELVEENEQLKKRNKFLEEFDGRAKTVANLKEENEQLKANQQVKQKIFEESLLRKSKKISEQQATITKLQEENLYKSFELKSVDDLKRLKDIFEICMILIDGAITDEDLELGYESVFQFERRIKKFAEWSDGVLR